MKTNNKTNPAKKYKWILLLSVIMVGMLYSITTSAQHYKKRSYGPRSYSAPGNFFVGFEALTGNRSFTLTSDIAEFNNVSVVEEGSTLGGVIGTSAILLRVRTGSYKPSASVTKRIELKETSVGLNIAPLQFTNRKPKYFEPYIVLDLDANSVLLYGKPFPPRPKQTQPPNNNCTCPCCQLPEPGEPEAPEPETVPSDGELTEVYLGKIKVMNASAGLGVMCNITGKKTFAKLFAEAKYGAAFRTSTTTLELRDTKTSNQFTLNFGVIMGLNARGWFK